MASKQNRQLSEGRAKLASHAPNGKSNVNQRSNQPPQFHPTQRFQPPGNKNYQKCSYSTQQRGHQQYQTQSQYQLQSQQQDLAFDIFKKMG
ncbi:uncharacterized protein N7482_010664 [Penicillium canariense]|uniref:Uncharacterized protein n=1 Tax=Penicillium canariense TaxID=189055 RepID=A0A9W9HL22_9EURO|nr:uncharacterized protein N7482_010664 [Penicillium canariense]KAJ5151412.1 hypothetical protein N7482_010664 [Penicillium canariense]